MDEILRIDHLHIVIKELASYRCVSYGNKYFCIALQSESP
jgi:hypothetical protein